MYWLTVSSKIICSIFKHSPVFRIGGDEFAVILEGEDCKRYTELTKGFADAVKEYNKCSRVGEPISIAQGIAFYEEHKDITYADVFQRADSAMYQNKAHMKMTE